jgi:hypothetical protein
VALAAPKRAALLLVCVCVCVCVTLQVGNPEADPPLRPDGKLAVGAAVGQGQLCVTRSHPSQPRPYTGVVSIVSGEVAEDLANYLVRCRADKGWRAAALQWLRGGTRGGVGFLRLHWPRLTCCMHAARTTARPPAAAACTAAPCCLLQAESEQTNSALALGVCIGRDLQVKSAGGYLVQVCARVCVCACKGGGVTAALAVAGRAGRAGRAGCAGQHLARMRCAACRALLARH